MGRAEMPKKTRVEDPFGTADENDRVVELWFHAQVPPKFWEKHAGTNLMFASNVMGEEERALACNLVESDSPPEPFSIRFFRRKVNLAPGALLQVCNETHKMTVYIRNSGMLESDVAAPKPSKRGAKKERPRKGDDSFFTDTVETLTSLEFDFMDLLTSCSAKYPLQVDDGSLFRNCVMEICCAEPFLPPNRFDRYRPLKFEICSLNNLPDPRTLDTPLSVSVNFGDISISSPKVSVPHSGRSIFRQIVFLGQSTPLQVYREAFFKPLVVTLLDDKANAIGRGSASVREYVTDNRTTFSEMVHLLPIRSGLYGCVCLTEGTFVLLKLDFFSPLPPCCHVYSDGRPAYGHFLTRGVIRMPYMTRWAGAVLSTFIATLLETKRPTVNDDVYQRKAPVVKPEVPSVKEKKKELKQHKGQQVVPQRPPSPPSPFSLPFEVVTPPGISGVEVMDDDTRIFCIEGPVSEIHKLFERMSAASGHDPQLVLLMNAELFIPQREYLSFPPLVTLPPSFECLDANMDAKGESALGDTPEANALGATLSCSEGAAVSPRPTELPGRPPSEQDASIEDSFDTGEVEANGTGGRIHRVRISATIASLVSHQRHLLKRSLSESCIACYSKLDAISSCSQLRQVVERDLFPTPEEVLALERSFGRMLGLPDVFGREEFVNVTNNVDMENFVYQGEVQETAADIDLHALEEKDVGKCVVFDAIRSGCCRRLPPFVEQRFPHACWLRVVSTNKNVLCAFPVNSQPSRSIRYRVEAEIIRMNGSLFIFALKSTSLAKGFTDSHNLSYEARLAASLRAKKRRSSSLQRGGALSLEILALERSLQRTETSGATGDDSSESPRKDADTRARTQVAASLGKYPDSKRRHILPVCLKPSREEQREQYALCWEIYRRRAPQERPKLPKGPPMRF